MVSFQTWLDKNFPKAGRREIKKIWVLDPLWGQGLEGHLDLRNFKKLRELHVVVKSLTGIDLGGCLDLEIIDIRDDGGSVAINLEVFSHLTKLKSLDLTAGRMEWRGTWLEQRNRRNNFCGSLEALKNCKNLELLYITNLPNIKGGLEYLPSKNLTYFGCQGTEFEKQLKPFNFNVRAWQLANHPKQLKINEGETENEEFITTEIENQLIIVEQKLETIYGATIEQEQNQSLWVNLYQSLPVEGQTEERNQIAQRYEPSRTRIVNELAQRQSANFIYDTKVKILAFIVILIVVSFILQLIWKILKPFWNFLKFLVGSKKETEKE